MSGGFTFYCTPQDFAERLGKAVNECGLRAFSRHQNTNEVRPLDKNSFDCEDVVLEWLWDLWIAMEVPPSGIPEIPARAGWVLTRPPRVVTKARTIESAWVAARTDWIEPAYDGFFENEDLKALYKEVKKRFARGVKRGPACWFANGRADRAYYTPGALLLQQEGWRFEYSVGGPIFLGADSIPPE